MAIEIRVPTFGESVVEATVGRWLKSEGERVAAGDPVVVLETEKVTTELAAEDSGVLARIVAREGETVHPGDVLGIIEPVVEARAVAAGAPAPAAPPAAPPTPAPAAAVEREKVRVSPVAQRLAEELDVDLGQVPGSGPAGRIMKEDVEGYARRHRIPMPAMAPAATAPPMAPAAPVAPAAPAVAPPPTAAPERPEIRQRLSRRRLTIARRLVEAQQSMAMLTTFNEIDMHAVVELRRRRRDSFRAATGVDLGFMSFFVKAVVGALKAFPRLNAELQGEELVIKQYYDIGIAIGDPEGLVVPVLRNADRLTFAQIEQGIAEFVQRASEHTLTLEELRGGTFTITNGGVFGSLLSTPIVNPPQVGILGMHKIAERPVAANGEVVIRPTMFVALTYDHRVIDGRDSVLFLVRVKELVEDPGRLLLET